MPFRLPPNTAPGPAMEHIFASSAVTFVTLVATESHEPDRDAIVGEPAAEPRESVAGQLLRRRQPFAHDVATQRICVALAEAARARVAIVGIEAQRHTGPAIIRHQQN